MVIVFVVTVTILSTIIVTVVLILRFCRPNKEKTQVMYVDDSQMEAMNDPATQARNKMKHKMNLKNFAA